MSDSFNYLLRIGKAKGHEMSARSSQSFQSYLCVELDEKLIYVAVESVREVSNKLEVFPLGHTQAWFKGIMKFQGDIFSVVDLGFFLTGSLSKNRQRTAVALSQDAGNYAILVDKVQGIHRLRNLSEKTENNSDYTKNYIGEDGSEFTVLDPTKLAESKEFLNPALF